MPSPRNGTKPQQLISKVFTLAALVAVTTCSCEDEQPQQVSWRYPDSLLGTWVRVYPAPVGSDTVRIEPNGVARGAKSAVSATHIRWILRWEISSLDPRQLCFGDHRARECSGYQLRGDALALAIPAQPVLIRAEKLRLDSAWIDSVETGGRSLWGDSVPATRLSGRQ